MSEGGRPTIRFEGRDLVPGPQVAGPDPREPRERPPRQGLPTRRKVITGVLAAGVLSAGGLFTVLRDDQESSGQDGAGEASPSNGTAGQQYQRDVELAFATFAGVFNITLIGDLQNLQEDQPISEQTLTALQPVPSAIRLTRQMLQGLSAPTERIAADFRAATTVYFRSARLLLLLGAQSRRPLLDQIRIQAIRLQQLGDRLYDQGRADLRPFLPEPRALRGLIIRPPAEIPDFTNGGLLPGPPLVPGQEGTVDLEDPGGSPKQPVQGWVRGVAALEVPAANELVALLRSGSGPELGELGNRLSAAALNVRRVDDPVSGRPDSTRVQLALLLQAEAARAGEAARSVSAGALREELLVGARVLAAQGDALWDERLGTRTTGLPDALLEIR